MWFAAMSGRSTASKPPPAETFERLSLEQLDGLYNFALHQSSDSSTAQDLVVKTYVRARSRFERLPNSRADPGSGHTTEAILRSRQTNCEATAEHYPRSGPSVPGSRNRFYEAQVLTRSEPERPARSESNPKGDEP